MHNGGAMAEMVTVLTGLSLFVVMVLLCARQRSQMYAHSYMASGQAGFPPQGYMVRGYSDAGYGPGHVAASGATGFLGGMMLHEAMSERHQNAYVAKSPVAQPLHPATPRRIVSFPHAASKAPLSF